MTNAILLALDNGSISSDNGSIFGKCK